MAERFFVMQKPMFPEDEGRHFYIGCFDTRDDAEAAIERVIAKTGPPTPTRRDFHIAS